MNIQPLGEQIIIKTIPQDSVGSIVIPDTAKGITMMGKRGAEDAVHFVEAEVIALGPGKPMKGDPKLIDDMAHVLSLFLSPQPPPGRTRIPTDAELYEFSLQRIMDLIARAENRDVRHPFIVKPGDRILYHPAVQKFDRDITDVMSNGNEDSGSKYFMIREDSVLAVIE